MLGRAKTNRKDWISKETWEIVEKTKEVNNVMNNVRTGKQSRDASKKYQS